MPRLRYPDLAPEGYAALTAFGHYVNTATALDPVLRGLVYLRASLLNGCRFCIQMHTSELRKLHEPETRIEAVRTAPCSDAFTLREQAALRWTDRITHLSGEEVSEDEYAAVHQFFAGKDLVDLTYAIANINAWNRLGVAFQPEWRETAGQPSTAKSAPGSAPAALRSHEVSAVDDDGGKVAQD